MIKKIFAIFYITTIALAEVVMPGIEQQISDGVKSLGYKVVYGDEDMTILNEVVQDFEKSAVKEKIHLNESIKPLPAQDVKCLMSVDRYCSKEMGKMKSVLIQALKEDCKQCSTDQKEAAGKVIASMMAHDPVAWKLFLTRSALLLSKNKKKKQEETVKFREVGPAEEIEHSSSRFTLPGVKVRVRRYTMEKV